MASTCQTWHDQHYCNVLKQKDLLTPRRSKVRYDNVHKIRAELLYHNPGIIAKIIAKGVMFKGTLFPLDMLYLLEVAHTHGNHPQFYTAAIFLSERKLICSGCTCMNTATTAIAKAERDGIAQRINLLGSKIKTGL